MFNTAEQRGRLLRGHLYTRRQRADGEQTISRRIAAYSPIMLHSDIGRVKCVFDFKRLWFGHSCSAQVSTRAMMTRALSTLRANTPETWGRARKRQYNFTKVYEVGGTIVDELLC